MSSQNNNKSNPTATLLSGALATGQLSQASFQSLNVVDIGAQIQAGLGVHVDDVGASEVLLVTMMPDDSGSIRFAGNAKAVREGHNSVLRALKQSKQKDGILVHTRYLNGDILYPYCPLSDGVDMTSANYNPCHGTPLYDQTMVLLGTVLAKSQEFEDNGVMVRSVTLLITDGDDQHSQNYQSAQVRKLVQDMQRAENHIVAAMGVEDGSTDFRKVFSEMGIADNWILTPKNSAHEIRSAFQVFSQSALQLASGAPAVQWAGMAGFATN